MLAAGKPAVWPPGHAEDARSSPADEQGPEALRQDGHPRLDLSGPIFLLRPELALLLVAVPKQAKPGTVRASGPPTQTWGPRQGALRCGVRGVPSTSRSDRM